MGRVTLVAREDAGWRTAVMAAVEPLKFKEYISEIIVPSKEEMKSIKNI